MSDKPYLLLHGDCLAQMRALRDASIDAVVSDPPYGFSFMGKGWDHGVPGEAYWREAFRVLKPGAHLVAFGGPRTYHRLACAIEDAGFEVRDSLHWIFGTGFPKGGEAVTKRKGMGTALKPAHEPIILARKPLSGTVAANIVEHGTGALAIDACRVGVEPRFNPPTRKGSTAALGSFANCNGAGSHVTGRFPPNLLLSHIPECGDTCADGCAVDELGRQSGVQRSGVAVNRNHVSGDTKKAAVYGSFSVMTEDFTHGDTGTAARFFPCFRYQAKASRGEREAGLEEAGLMESGIQKYGSIRANRGAGYAEESTARNHHPTVKPIDLMRWLVRLVTPPGGVVLDPFMGSGSTGCAAVQEGARFVGIEREAEYLDIARARIAHWFEKSEKPPTEPVQPDLFAEAS